MRNHGKKQTVSVKSETKQEKSEKHTEVKATSKPRYNWWPFVLNMIHDYPARVCAYRELHQPRVSNAMAGQSGGNGQPRPVERIATRQLPSQEQKEYDAVRQALERTRRMPSSQERILTIRMTLLRSTHTISGAAAQLHITDRTARRYRYQFIVLVAYTYGLITEDDYTNEVRKDFGNKKTDPRSL